MIGVDSNVLLRWIVDDGQDRAQTAQAARAIGSETVHISIISLVEVLWVLRSRYGISKPDRLALVERMLATANIVLQHSDALTVALKDTDSYGGDLPDHLLAALNEAAMCDYTLTFDRKAARSPKFKRLTTEDT